MVMEAGGSPGTRALPSQAPPAVQVHQALQLCHDACSKVKRADAAAPDFYRSGDRADSAWRYHGGFLSFVERRTV